MRPDAAQTTRLVTQALEPAVGRDWSVRAGRLDWTVEFTVEHIASALSKYTLYLASRSTEPIALRIESWPDSSQRERIDAIASVGRALRGVAAQTPPDARAFHANGLFDADGYEAFGCLECLVHGHDIAEGLGLDFAPPAEITQPVIARLVPWIEPTWESLLKHTGRIGASNNDEWTILTQPLNEWDGTIPV